MKTKEVPTKELLSFIKRVEYHIAHMDEIMKQKESPERGKMIGKEMNHFETAADAFLMFGCNVPLKNLNKVLNKTFKI